MVNCAQLFQWRNTFKLFASPPHAQLSLTLLARNHVFLLNIFIFKFYQGLVLKTKFEPGVGNQEAGILILTIRPPPYIPINNNISQTRPSHLPVDHHTSFQTTTFLTTTPPLDQYTVTPQIRVLHHAPVHLPIDHLTKLNHACTSTPIRITHLPQGHRISQKYHHTSHWTVHLTSHKTTTYILLNHSPYFLILWRGRGVLKLKIHNNNSKTTTPLTCH